MLQIRSDPDLGQEPLWTEQRAEVGAENLERDAAVVPQVARKVDCRHAASTDLALDLVPACESRIQVGNRFHGRNDTLEAGRGKWTPGSRQIALSVKKLRYGCRALVADVAG